MKTRHLACSAILLLVAAESACAGVCQAGAQGVTFVKESRLIPYQRMYLDAGWSADEQDAESAHRYPIHGFTGSAGKFDPPGFYAAAFRADYYPVQLEKAGDSSSFRISGLVYADAPADLETARHFVLKYSSKDVSYRISFAANPHCEENADIPVEVYKGATHVETILFHVRDMTDAKDFWPEERAGAHGP